MGEGGLNTAGSRLQTPSPAPSPSASARGETMSKYLRNTTVAWASTQRPETVGGCDDQACSPQTSGQRVELDSEPVGLNSSGPAGPIH